MSQANNRKALLARFHETVAKGQPLVVAGVGSGITAKGAVEGGADLLATYNTAVYRVANLPTPLAFLPYDDANELTLSAATEVVGNAAGRPVICGFGAHDPRRSLAQLISRGLDHGAVGITNEPFVGVYEPELQRQLEAAGYGFSREVELINQAAQRDLLSLGWAFDKPGIRAMIDAGADLVGIMLGLSGPADAADEDRELDRLADLCEAAAEKNPDTLIVIHGGPLGDPATVGKALARCKAHGYVTGSSAERTPVVTGVAHAVREFKSLESHAGIR